MGETGPRKTVIFELANQDTIRIDFDAVTLIVTKRLNLSKETESPWLQLMRPQYIERFILIETVVRLMARLHRPEVQVYKSKK